MLGFSIVIIVIYPRLQFWQKMKTYSRFYASPQLTAQEWLEQHNLLNPNPEPVMLENISPDQLIDQHKQET